MANSNINLDMIDIKMQNVVAQSNVCPSQWLANQNEVVFAVDATKENNLPSHCSSNLQ